MIFAIGLGTQLMLIVAGLVVVAAFVAAARSGDKTISGQPLPPSTPPVRIGPPAGERRSASRAAIVRPVLLRRGDPAAEPTRTFAVDISAAGIMLAGPADLTVGERTWMRVELDGATIDGEGVVVRETEQGYKGVRFETVAPADRSALVAYLSRVGV
ncbi:MAG TPA: PilZ domain-containing protein [Solirubrobacteraceae bacterium]|jgi:hypothetical protein